MLRDKLGIRCPSTLLTSELEAEVFLHLLERHADAVGAAAGPQADAAASVADQGDGSAAARQQQRQRGDPGLVQRLLAPLRLGQEEVGPALAKLGSALALSNLGTSVLQQLGGRLVSSHLRYEAAMHLALSAGAKGMQGRAAMQVSRGRRAAASAIQSGMLRDVRGCCQPRRCSLCQPSRCWLCQPRCLQLAVVRQRCCLLLPCLPRPPRRALPQLHHATPPPARCWALWVP